jgi:acyl-CoA thioester hydrolase
MNTLLQNDAGEPIALDVANPFLFPVVVRPEDLDGHGHVNNTVYVRWMDQAALAHSEAVGYDWEEYRRIGASFVVRRHEVDYLMPAFADDRIVVATWPCRMEKVTARRRHQIVRRDDGKTLVRAATTWVYLDLQSGKPCRIPQVMVERFGAHQDDSW